VEQTAPNSRDKILEVAEALFARRGFAGVGLRQVADQAGLGKSSLFHHFRSKAQLYLAVLDRVLVGIDERLAGAAETGGAPMQRLDRMVDTLIDALAEQPATARLLLRSLFEEDDLPAEAGSAQEATDRITQRILARIDTLLREGMKEGVFRPVSVGHTIQTLIGATVYHFASGEFGELLLGRSLLSSEEVRQRKEEVKALIHHGLAASSAS